MNFALHAYNAIHEPASKRESWCQFHHQKYYLAIQKQKQHIPHYFDEKTSYNQALFAPYGSKYIHPTNSQYTFAQDVFKFKPHPK